MAETTVPDSRPDSGRLADSGGDLDQLLALAPAAVNDLEVFHRQVDQLLGSWPNWLDVVTALEAVVRRQPSAGALGLLGRAREYAWNFLGAVEAYTAAAQDQPSPWAAERQRAIDLADRFRPFNGLLIAHRGSSGGAPENAVEGLASVPPYVAGVEVDVRLSADRVPVLMHDATIDRTTDGAGAVGKLSHDQLRAARGRHGARIPTLHHYLDACAGRGFRRVLVDIKAVGRDDLAAIGGVVAESVVADDCVLLVRDESHLVELRERYAELRLGFFGVSLDNLERRITVAQDCRAEVLFVVHGDEPYLANREVVSAIRAAGLQAGASVINRRDAVEATRVDCCDYVLTDRSEQLRYFSGA